MVPREEVVEILTTIAAGDITPYAEGPTWHEVFTGNVAFIACDWRIVVFNDCGEYDYIDLVVAPDGRVGDYDDWDPEPLLEDEAKQAAVEAAFRNAQRSS